MTTPKHLRFVTRGSILGTPEIWSMSFKYKATRTAQPDLSASDIDASDVHDAGSTFFTSGIFDARLRWEDWRLYLIGTDGRMEGEPNVNMLETSDFVTGVAAVKYPPQVSCCVTFVGASRGYARYGRAFMPCVGPAIAGDSRMTTENSSIIAEAFSTFVKDVSGAIDTTVTSANQPLVNISSVGAGRVQEVDHIEVGRVLDTQRRRRNAMLEERVSTGHIDW